MKQIGIPEALQSLRPGAEWVVRGEEIEWLDLNQSQPSKEEIEAEIKRLNDEYDNNEYQRERASSYPTTFSINLFLNIRFIVATRRISSGSRLYL